ncbi:MAG: chromosome segregation protein SMC, partial [Saprospiraceae bacterium]
MRLKTLEIKGFKSFANETVVHFGEDVIGIVGPNGSGKSNIVDAIRWVLGEQSSRELRLDTMASVIFNGTKKRRSAPFASVSLTFENTKNLLPTEYQNVSITRILYQSGDSEYKLNNVTCRLRDITGLFLDTGIGSNSYAIIALGMVDDILNDKENSRLKMLEQAAGISKYKIRKRETLLKLKNTDADLERVEDLLFEIEGNLKTLEQQARKARRYFEIKDQYKGFSIQLASIKVGRLKDRHKEIKGQLTQEEDRYRQFDVETTQLESQLEAEKKANLDKEKALSDRQRDLNALVGKIRNKENERSMLKQRLDFINQNRQKLEQQILANNSRIKELEVQIQNYREDLNDEKRIEARMEIELNQAEDKLKSVRAEHGSAKSDLDEILKGQQTIERELFELEKRKAINSNRLDNLEFDKAQSESSNNTRIEEQVRLKSSLKDLEQKEELQQNELEVLLKEADQRQTAILEAEQELDQLRQKMTALNRQLDAKKNEFKLTQSMVESMEGFPESIKFLSTQKEWIQKAPLLSDLIYVHEEYRVAIENYLEPYLNYYVVPTIEDAYKAIKLLSQSQKGKANFFVLDAFKDYNPPMTLLPDTTNAYELVNTDPAYRNLCSFLLENVLVTEDEDVTKVQQEGDFVLLSKSGRFIKRRFSISGGSIGLFEGKKIGRKKNLEMLETAIKKLEKEEDKLATSFYNLKSKIEQLKTERDDRKIHNARESLSKVTQERISISSKLENLNNVLKESGDKEQRIIEEITQLIQANQEIENNLEAKTAQINTAKAQISEVDASFKKMSDQLSEASSAFNEKNIAFIRQQNKVSAFQRELNFREKSYEEIASSVKKDSSNLEQASEEDITIKDNIAQLEKELQEAYAERKERESLLTAAEQNYFQARGGINEIEDKLRKLNKSRTDVQILINNLKDKLSDVRLDLSSLSERLRVEFSININELNTENTE